MKTILYIFLMALIPLSISCTKEDEDNELTKDGRFHISELVGTWEATQAQFSVSTVSVDVVAAGGTATMTVDADGRFVLTLDPVDRAAYTVRGEFFWEEWQQTFYFAIVWDDEPGDWDTYGHTFNGTTLSINGGADSGEYDFDGDGDFEACSVHFIFVRNGA